MKRIQKMSLIAVSESGAVQSKADRGVKSLGGQLRFINTIKMNF